MDRYPHRNSHDVDRESSNQHPNDMQSILDPSPEKSGGEEDVDGHGYDGERDGGDVTEN